MSERRRGERTGFWGERWHPRAAAGRGCNAESRVCCPVRHCVALVVGVPSLAPAVAPGGCEGRAGTVSEREREVQSALHTRIVPSDIAFAGLILPECDRSPCAVASTSAAVYLR